jgi:hypothetical protein
MEEYLASKEQKLQEHSFSNENSQTNALSPINLANEISFGAAASSALKSFGENRHSSKAGQFQTYQHEESDYIGQSYSRSNLKVPQITSNQSIRNSVSTSKAS